MGKRRVQVKQVRRQQMRQVKPKAPPVPSGPTDQKKQRQKYVASGGMLQGYPPELVERIGYVAIGIAVLCLLMIVELLVGPVKPSSLFVRIAAALAWVLPLFLLASFVLPGFRLARRDRKQEARVVQGQLVGASSVSTSLGLGMLMVKTRAGNEQYLVAPEKLAKVPGNIVQVVLTVTPGLKHVRGLSVMGQRMVPRAEPPSPPVIRQMRLLPIVTPAALAIAIILGADIVAFLPIENEGVHVLLVVLAAAALGGLVYSVSFFLQRRLMTQVRALLPEGTI
jgi:hypothetical protein